MMRLKVTFPDSTVVIVEGIAYYYFECPSCGYLQPSPPLDPVCPVGRWRPKMEMLKNWL